jgi:hypothetical protein
VGAAEVVEAARAEVLVEPERVVLEPVVLEPVAPAVLAPVEPEPLALVPARPEPELVPLEPAASGQAASGPVELEPVALGPGALEPGPEPEAQPVLGRASAQPEAGLLAQASVALQVVVPRRDRRESEDHQPQASVPA